MSIRNKLVKLMMRLQYRNLGSEEDFADLPKLRAKFEKDLKPLNRLPSNVEIEEVVLTNCKAMWITPKEADPNRVMLYLHGGAYIFGSITTHQRGAYNIAESAGTKTLVLDYRLSPEHKHPAAIDDALEAYQYIIRSGIDPEMICIAGDSAGGGLTLATLHQLREQSMPMPACAVLLSPWADLSLTALSLKERAANDPVLKEGFLKRSADAYVNDPSEITAPTVSPVEAEFEGFPPMLIIVGTDEILYDDSITVTEKARAAGVDVHLVIGEDMMHDYPLMSALIPEAKQAVNDIGAYIKKALSNGAA